MYYLWNDVLNLLEVSKVKLGEEKIKFWLDAGNSNKASLICYQVQQENEPKKYVKKHKLLRIKAVSKILTDLWLVFLFYSP